MYPGSFIWARIGDRWLVSKSAAAAFAVSSVVILAMTVAIVRTEPQNVGSIVQFLLGIGGVLGAVSVFFLWGGMWNYWAKSDSSSLAARRVWFFALVFGLWYGAVIYYLLVYLPGTLRSRTLHPRRGES